MSDQSYYDKRLPDLIRRLKSQVMKNMDIINREVESQLGEDKFFNVLKGRRMAVEEVLHTMTRIDQLQKGTYRKDNLPLLIERLKEMYDITLEVVDMDIDARELDEEALDHLDDPGESMARAFAKAGNLTEDKYHAVLKARRTAGDDAEWALKKIDELESELSGKEQTVERKKSWALRAAER